MFQRTPDQKMNSLLIIASGDIHFYYIAKQAKLKVEYDYHKLFSIFSRDSISKRRVYQKALIQWPLNNSSVVF